MLRILYRWLEEEDEITTDPMARMKPPIVPEQPVPVVAEDSLRRLLAAFAGKTFEARRDIAVIMFLLDTGARRAELAGLRLADLDFDLDVALVLGNGPPRARAALRPQDRRRSRPLRARPRPSQGRRPAMAVAWAARPAHRPRRTAHASAPR